MSQPNSIFIDKYRDLVSRLNSIKIYILILIKYFKNKTNARIICKGLLAKNIIYNCVFTYDINRSYEQIKSQIIIYTCLLMTK